MGIVNVTLNPNDMGVGHTLSNGNLTDTFSSSTNIRATHGKTTGKWYWEVKLDSGSLQLVSGITNKLYPITSTTMTGSTGDALNLRAYQGVNGYRYPENGLFGTSSAWAVGNVIGIALDLDNGKLEFYKNGVSMGISHTNLNGMGEVFPFFRSSDTVSKTFTVNFGASTFVYPIPNGYLPYVNYPVNKILILDSYNTYLSVSNSFTTDLTPTMTSATVPSPYQVLKSSEYNTTYSAWKVFDKNLATVWMANDGNPYITFDFGSQMKINSYSITSGDGSGNAPLYTRSPLSFNLYGSNDNANWALIDSQNNLSIWGILEKRVFDLSNDENYRYYMLRDFDKTGTSLAIGEMAFYYKQSATLKELESQSEQNYINHGMDKSTELDLSEEISNRVFIEQSPTMLGSGKVFTKQIDTSSITIKSVEIV